MNVLSFADSLAHHFRTFQLDDSSVALIALLAGMIGGYRITGWHAQLKAKRAKIGARPPGMPRTAGARSVHSDPYPHRNATCSLLSMRYLALCCDYDGTLATEGEVFPETAAALERLVASKRRLVLVTGRELDQLQTVCPYLDLFEYVVAENGALLYEPATRKETLLAQRPPDSFVAALRARGVGPISVGRVIVATWEPHETVVLESIKDHGLELQVIFNKGAVMILPAGVNKATGLMAALKKMGLS